MAQRQGILGVAVRNPLTGELYADGIVRSRRSPTSRARCWRACRSRRRPAVANNFDSLPRRKNYNDKFDIKFDQQLNAGADRVRPLQPSQG